MTLLPISPIFLPIPSWFHPCTTQTLHWLDPLPHLVTSPLHVSPIATIITFRYSSFPASDSTFTLSPLHLVQSDFFSTLLSGSLYPSPIYVFQLHPPTSPTCLYLLIILCPSSVHQSPASPYLNPPHLLFILAIFPVHTQS